MDAGGVVGGGIACGGAVLGEGLSLGILTLPALVFALGAAGVISGLHGLYSSWNDPWWT